MPVELILEYNRNGALLHFPAYPGAYARGETEAAALEKAGRELTEYVSWAALPPPREALRVVKRVRARDELQINDADSEILLDCDRFRLPQGEFDRWCRLAMRSAGCVMALYDSIADKEWVQPEKARRTFYGKTPSTAREMLAHMDGVSGYYLSRLNIDAPFVPGNMVKNRESCMESLRLHYVSRQFEILEADGEQWTETKVLRRFIWHDRIHARAMLRHGIKMGMKGGQLDNGFCFGCPP